MKLRIIKRRVSGIHKVVLNVPKLEDLYVRLDMSTVVFVMEDLSSLISAKLSIYNDGCHPFWVEVLKGLSGAKSLTFVVHVDLKTPSDTQIPNFPYLKHLEFKVSSSYNDWDWRLFHQMLENSPELEHLCVMMNPKDQKDSSWIEPQSVPTCILNNLRTMKFANFKGRKSHLQFFCILVGECRGFDEADSNTQIYVLVMFFFMICEGIKV
uniref:F-box/FBD/LRR-repeat protein At4g26340-like n=1 Tax=Erigeron canadensis TaxID=72917 RepID=UPI001CB96D64|nr:F-box/FBD/LRR-repeat protein At4g26340-like [Erigeron canadensis]